MEKGMAFHDKVFRQQMHNKLISVKQDKVSLLWYKINCFGIQYNLLKMCTLQYAHWRDPQIKLTIRLQGIIIYQGPFSHVPYVNEGPYNLSQRLEDEYLIVIYWPIFLS